MANPLMFDSVWRDKQKFEEAEAQYQQVLAGTAAKGAPGAKDKKSGKSGGSTIKNEIAEARQQIQKVLNSHKGNYIQIIGGSGGASSDNSQVMKRVASLEKENRDLKKVVEDMKTLVQKLENRVSKLEGGTSAPSAQAPAPPKPAPAEDDDDDDDIDLFGSDEDDEEVDRIRKERLAAYEAKKAKKPALIAKSSLILDVKPWDDETDMKKMEEEVRKITADGLLWGAAKLVPVGYGIKKLQINCVIEDDKISTDFLEDEITALEDYVQSMDIAAFNKI
ncbi:elongation factor 1-delta-like isoform X2 [Saccostrea echinata]|uniref:elongation factor 1-delta-like isoform X1 n=1 Tax=Saccostrea echinata TaxID=191078 RepID=UPI002A81FE53|nr:elongation factor 1-delta-like isoform X1 [Saccostrea echinata]XP_061177872.1 elongation factor 1-delta-like isoform X2 [Saccostrea echinata]